MLRTLAFCALIVLALVLLVGCGAGAQPTVTAIPATATFAPTATVAGSLTPAPIGGTPLPMATNTPAAPPSPTALPPTPTSVPTEAVSATETAMIPDETPTNPPPPPEASPTGAATPGGTPTGTTVEVISFNVWQDFMPSIGTNGPPLNASVELNVTNRGATPIQNVLPTRIVVRRPDGEVVLDRGVQSTPSDTDPTGPLAPGETRHYSFRSAPSDNPPLLTENEAVTGALTINFDSAEQTVPLPATRVQFTH